MDHEFLAGRFEEHRPRLRAVAYRMLGSSGEADEAVREAWGRLSRAGAGGGAGEIDDLGGRLTTAVARVCLNTLRAREARREDPWDPWDPWGAGEPGKAGEPGEPGEPGADDPEQRALLAVLDTLTPAERLAFVLHDLFDVPVEEIAPIVERTPAATRQLAARARRRVQGTEEMPEPDLPRQREVVTAFLAATQSDDVEGLLALLDPDVVLRADTEALRTGTTTAHGARAVAEAVAESLTERVREARVALVDGAAGLVWAPDGKPRSVIGFTVIDGRITAVDILMDPSHLSRLDVELPQE
ncbi:sigma factor-like helix-turn-helix DNA-binding protein [Streptomyces vilmorinianum]|uniref:sigma factor-like helix-turn-helix DNA-binding protein n=1 Tax=Streptomyces vilmorinianum TaxID=3051092 RepID=UPI0020C7BBA8|nr:sigma factor-like helix-turn-helix DNA-binding protein [Streptomyces vilmorinianum]